MGSSNKQFPSQTGSGCGWFVIFMVIGALFMIVDLILKLK